MTKGEGDEDMSEHVCSETVKAKQRADGSYDTIQCTRKGVASFTIIQTELTNMFSHKPSKMIEVEHKKWLCNHHKNAFLKTWSMGAHIAHNERCIAGEHGKTLQNIAIDSKRKAEELDPDGSLRVQIRETTNSRIKAKQKKMQAEREGDLLLEVSMFRETLPLLWRLIRRKLFNDRDLEIEEIGMEGYDTGTEIAGAIDGPLPRIAEIQRHIEWFIETYDMEWPDINLSEVWDLGQGKASDKWSGMMKTANGNYNDGDVDEYGDMIDS